MRQAWKLGESGKVSGLRQQTKLIEEMSGQLWEELGEQLVDKMASRLESMLEDSRGPQQRDFTLAGEFCRQEKLKSVSATGGEAAHGPDIWTCFCTGNWHVPHMCLVLCKARWVLWNR